MNKQNRHPKGESETTALVPYAGPVAVDTFGGRVHVEWDPQAAVTPLGQLPFFTEFLQVSGVFDPWVESCPLLLTSPNAPGKRDVLGTAVLAILSGHQRYAHISALRGDTVNPPLLGMSKVVSEDSVRANLGKMDETQGVTWLQDHLGHCVRPLLSEPWILDTDVTVKPLYGPQEGAVKGYNPHKPGRPSHTYHTYFIANLRLAGWSRARRTIVLRRQIKADLAVVDESNPEQLRLSIAELTDDTVVYEYAVLVTSLPGEILTIAQLYRDRADADADADAENPFDELKNHWGWGGFTTQDLKRCRFMARLTALTYNWWSLFVRLADPRQHTEAITSRPLLLHAPARLTRHGGQTRVTISHPHAEAAWVENACREIAAFFKTLRQTAEQLTPLQRWYRVLSRALVKYLNGRELHPPPGLPAPA